MTSLDPTYVKITIENADEKSPFKRRLAGRTNHDGILFDEPYITHVTGNLFVGGCENFLVLPEMFDHLVSLYKWEQYTIDHEIESRLVVRLFDSASGFTGEGIMGVIDWAHSRVELGPTLIQCQAGLNRSNLIAGGVLIKNGLSADEAIDMLREARGPAVLCNPAFESFLRANEESIRNPSLRTA